MTEKERSKIKIIKKLQKSLTVKQLKKILEEYPDDALVGRVGHFGEALLCDEVDIHGIRLRDAYAYAHTWRDMTRMDIKILCIPMPDPGPDPD